MIDRQDFYLRIITLIPDAKFVYWPDDGSSDNKGYSDVKKIDDWMIYWDVNNSSPLPTIEQILSIPKNIIDTIKFESTGTQLLSLYIDSIAQEKQYDSALSCSSYIMSSNPQWKMESQAFIAWRDSVFNYVIEQIALMKSGYREVPEFDTFKLELPIINWP